MTIQSPSSRRVEEARRQVGRTAVGGGVARALVAACALVVAAPPLVQTAIDWRAGRGPLPAFEPLVQGLRRALSSSGPRAANRALLAAIDESEDRLEEESWLRAELLPPSQWLLTRVLGRGNEQAISGRGGEWYYADDFEHTVGRGFLSPAVLERRWRAAGVQPDPVLAIRSLNERLERRGVALLLVPVPAKTAIMPAGLAARPVEPPVQNVSFQSFLDRLETAGIQVYDPSRDLLAVAAGGTAPFLRADTHWTPAGLEVVADGIAERLVKLADLPPVDDAYYRRTALVEGRGDLAAMLKLPPAAGLIAGERVEAQVVLTAEGRPWRADENASILLLGDSFTNVFSEPALGWGAGAGLAEQLSHRLGRPLDRIARNAGGAYRSRQELSDERLRGKRVVVYEFAARELSAGDWRLFDDSSHR